MPLNPNPAFDYCRSNFNVDTARFEAWSDELKRQAALASQKFARKMGCKVTPDLEHFFFDALLLFISSTHLGSVHSDQRAASAVLDGVHLRHYGDQGQHAVLVPSLEPSPSCFAASIRARGDDMFYLASLAMGCVGLTGVLNAQAAMQALVDVLAAGKEASVSSLEGRSPAGQTGRSKSGCLVLLLGGGLTVAATQLATALH